MMKKLACSDLTSACSDLTSACSGLTSASSGLTSACSGLTSACSDLTSACSGLTSACSDLTCDHALPGENLFEISKRIVVSRAQGPNELPKGESMPLEYNFELFSGVAFNKGCYVGQELTARTHFRGQVN